ncbi:LysE family translocator [Pseudonocardiaceae bacterium YIM PH 21723]|nr:LysE family translocator [Pseudonocardiaceae bacterium YIM PH 21723]
MLRVPTHFQHDLAETLPKLTFAGYRGDGGGLGMFVPHVSVVLPFLLVSLVVAITPGVDMMFVLGQTLSRGGRAGRAALLGISAGLLVHATLATIGVSALIAADPRMLTVLTYAGAVYLVWIGIRTLRQSGDLDFTEAGSRTGSLFVRGFVTNVLNPKIILFFLTFLPQFVRPEAGPQWQQIAVFAVLFLIVGTPLLILITFAGDRAANLLRRNRRWARALPKVSGSIFLGLAASLLLR